MGAAQGDGIARDVGQIPAQAVEGERDRVGLVPGERLGQVPLDPRGCGGEPESPSPP
jgi:hypothetical protein